MSARLHFRLGRLYERAGKDEKARTAFIRARDLDGLSFRAPSEFSAIVRDVAADFGAPVAEIEAAFRERSPNGSLGADLLWEHVHPNFEGYFLMAKTWVSAMRENVAYSSQRRHRWQQWSLRIAF